MEGHAVTNKKHKVKLQCPWGHPVFSEGINVQKLYETTGIRVMSSQYIEQNDTEYRHVRDKWFSHNETRHIFTFRLNEPQWELMKKRKNQRCLGCEKKE